MYLRECFIENVGPITLLDLSLEADSSGNPKPIVLVGKNGTGKTIFLAHILDALAELAKKRFGDVVMGQRVGHSPYLKLTSGTSIRSSSASSLCLLELLGNSKQFYYIESVGLIDASKYTEKLGGRFKNVPWPSSDVQHCKYVGGDEGEVKDFFQNGSIGFFPSSRHERPHWLNTDAVEDETTFGKLRQVEGVLNKPIIIERAVESNQQWIIDVLIDSLADWKMVTLPTGQYTWVITSNMNDKTLLKTSQRNVEKVLQSILEDETAKFVMNYRNAGQGRLSIHLKSDVIIPSLNHLSTGQILLLNLFTTIIRYSDKSNLHKSINLNEIEGIILIDEIDAHLHTDLQYEVLPRLIKLFPKVQFIVTSHSPLFLLGMEREFGVGGVQIVEMPTGRQIDTERFDEFRKSFEYYSQTLAFEEKIEQQISANSKPIVFTEGQIDVAFIKAGLELLGHADLLERLEIYEVGNSGKDGTKGGGHTNLDAARKFLESKQDLFPRSVLLLYDADTNKPPENIGKIMVRSIPKNMLNTKVTKGIENLFPEEIFEDRFYKKTTKPTGYGSENLISDFQKMDFCNWVCKEQKNKEHFNQFGSLLLPILREFIELNDKR